MFDKFLKKNDSRSPLIYYRHISLCVDTKYLLIPVNWILLCVWPLWLSAGWWPSSPYSPVCSPLRSSGTVHCHCWSCAVLEASVHLANSAIHLWLSGLLVCGVGSEPRWIKFSPHFSSLGMQASFSPSRTFCLHEKKATSNFGLSAELWLINVCGCLDIR